MVHSGSGGTGRGGEGGLHPGSVARASKRLGTALVGAAVPALAATVFVAWIRAGTGLLAWAGGAMETGVVGGGTGLQWAFHVAAIVGLAGAWAFGFAFLVGGYFGVE
jgi:hypothetical protein